VAIVIRLASDRINFVSAPTSLFDLTGKVAIVSGGSRGIGEAIARAFVAAGAKVTITSRKLENVLAVADSINADYPGRCLAIGAHAGRQADAAAAVAETVDHFGRINIAVNNAGTNPHFGPLLTASESQWDKILEVNVKGYFWLCQAAAAQMQRQGGGGKIINVASIAGLEPAAMMGVYSVSKAAVLMLTQALATELGPDNIQVNAIAPGFIRTRFSAALWDNPAVYQGLVDRTPAGRMADPAELTGIALYLASEASSFTTGGVFVVDGGYTLT
jgi:NAD(P)-dependent dehydrogenase (short-subunit alcohol dehydrogenase family)